MLKKILPCLGKYKILAIITPLMVIGEVLLEVFIPFEMAKIIDVGIKNRDVTYVIRVGGLMIAMALISLFFGAMAARTGALAATGFAKGVRSKLFYKIQNFSFYNIDRFSTASLVTRLTTDVTNTQNAFIVIIRMLVRTTVMLISATAMAISINAKLSCIFLIAIPFMGITLALIVKTAMPLFKSMFKKYDAMNASVQENLVAVRVIKAFVRKDYENMKFEEAAADLRKAQMKAEKIVVFNAPVMMFTMYACTVAIAWFGGNLIIAGNMKTGEFFSFITYISQVLISLMMISFAFVNIMISRASVDRIIEVFDEEPDITDNEKGADLNDGSIEFEHVSFQYSKESEDLTLTDITLKINAGETVGIIGGTGSAKTTLVQLIPRLYDATEGKVLVGGHDVKDYSLKTLRDGVAMVLQKNVLFSGTIKENLKWGNPDATDEEVDAACKAASAYEFIQSFPEGFYTDLGQGGVNVSGGQKQRLCIARALLKNPKIIILDDSTSAVDTATDAKIRKAFKESLAQTTTIIIAQRITSVCDADKIIVMNDGQIDAIGTHEELLNTNKVYQEVYESQQKGVA